jgi:hypothetical protein
MLPLLALVFAIAAAALETHDARTAPTKVQRETNVQPAEDVIERILRYRRETRRWRFVMGLPAPRGQHAPRELAQVGPDYRHWVLKLWKRRALSARERATNPPRLRSWLCIHRYEGRWDDPHAPYYGGLQMDLSFQRSYGAHLLQRKGTADNWTPLEQIWVAERAYRSGRGFYPWPNTARMCGLI